MEKLDPLMMILCFSVQPIKTCWATLYYVYTTLHDYSQIDICIFKNSREKGVGFSLFFWLFWWSCVSSSSISANCAYCASFSKEQQQQLAEVHFCCSSALLRPTRGVKKANFPENLAKHNRSKTEQRDEKPIFIQYFI